MTTGKILFHLALLGSLNAYCLFISSVVIFLAVSACSEDEEFVFEGTVSIEAQDSSLVIFNQTNATIYYRAIERGYYNSTDPRPCYHPDDCKDTAIGPQRFTEIPYVDISGWKPGAEVVVVLWYLVKDPSVDSGYRLEGLPTQAVYTPVE